MLLMAATGVDGCPDLKPRSERCNFFLFSRKKGTLIYTWCRTVEDYEMLKNFKFQTASLDLEMTFSTFHSDIGHARLTSKNSL